MSDEPVKPAQNAVNRGAEFDRILKERFEWDEKSRIWWDTKAEDRRSKNPDYDGAGKIEIRRDPYEDDITIYNSVDETTIVHDLTESTITPTLAARYKIKLPPLELDRMIDMVWGTGIVVYWPAGPNEPFGAWEAL